MKVAQCVVDGSVLPVEPLRPLVALDPQLVLWFGDVGQLRSAPFVAAVRAAFPRATVAGCSTAGEISSDGVTNGRSVLTAVQFHGSRPVATSTEIADSADSTDAGRRLGAALPAEGLSHVLLFGPGVDVNGSALIDGLRAVHPGVTVSGGLAGDGGAFHETLTLGPNGAGPRSAVAIGLYGDQLLLGHGSFHGWVPFGPLRKVTRADGNLLYELDGEPALAMYRRYLGEYAKQLPASALLFPFEVVGETDGGGGLIRTILGIDEARGMLTLAGDVRQGGKVRLMHASTDSLVQGAHTAAQSAARPGGQGDALALLVSCVGRKLAMGARVDEEIEAVVDVLGREAWLAGFYSYGEISPVCEGGDCRLHNQTMTITYLSERA